MKPTTGHVLFVGCIVCGCVDIGLMCCLLSLVVVGCNICALQQAKKQPWALLFCFRRRRLVCTNHVSEIFQTDFAIFVHVRRFDQYFHVFFGDGTKP
jgi:hypothetical protein